MAKRSKKGSAGADGFGSSSAIADTENRVSQAAANANRKDQWPKGGTPSGAEQRVAGGGSKRGFFDVYKSGQGYHTRLGTAMASSALLFWFAYFLFEKLGTVAEDPKTARLWQVGISVAVIVVFGLVGYWLLGLNRKVCDFLIATEGEMKKVNWSTRKDIIGSTKVVVIMTLLMGSILFVVDIFFMAFFNSIGVLKGGGFIDTLKELF